MDFFEKYVSNTTAGSANQTVFFHGDGVGRVFYRLFCGGKFRYSFLFSNAVDSTFADGSISWCNRPCETWTLRAAACAVVKTYRGPEVPEGAWQKLTFSGESSKQVAPGEFFSSDPVEIEADAGEYLCVELSFAGQTVPCHEEILVPTFVQENGEFVPSKKMPVPQMVGCDRPVKKRVAYLGDSITQGIGTEPNSYTHWNHLVSEALGTEYAFWNLGIGYGRAADASTDGSWLYKAAQNDCIVVCFGVNDIFWYGDTEAIKGHLYNIVSLLKQRGLKVILQTTPPFNYDERTGNIWREVNRYIKEDLAQLCDGVFDVVPILGDPTHPEWAVYGGHPNAEGCRAWAQALIPAVKQVLEK